MKNDFNIDENQMLTICRTAMSDGGDFCDLYFENSFYNEILLRDGIVSTGGFHTDYGCGIRVLKGEKTGYAYAETTNYDTLLETAAAAGSIALAGKRSIAFKSAGMQSQPDFYGFTGDWRNADTSLLCRFLERLEAEIRRRDSRTLKVIASIESQMSDITMYNSFGELCCDTRPLATVAVSVIYSQGGKTVDKSCSVSMREGVEFLDDGLMERLARKATAGVDKLFEAGRPKGGRMSVVMGAGASGILLHEAMGHAFEADFNRKGQSVFADKMGKRVCPKGINIVDDGTLRSFRGSINYDDEGIPGQKTYMVRDGILESYLHDRISAQYYGVAPTGNGRRESFRYNPIPRMRSTYMESGASGTLDDLIASVKKGIYVDQFSNGEVKIGEGDFTFYVKSGNLIENGHLTKPIKDINIIGNGPKVLSDIAAVASDLIVDDSAWTCGKDQSAPVSCGIPSVLINNLTVGGE